MRPVLLASLTILVVSEGYAQTYTRSCYEPDAPRCLTAYDTFDNDYSFNSCLRDLNRYDGEVDDYIACLKGQVEDLVSENQGKVDDVNDQRSRSVAYWNCKARDSSSYCPSP